ncbi:MAG: putative transposase, partial [Myxococcaceae bacterium]
LAIDAVVAALAVGQRCVEGVRRLATSTSAALLLASGAPSATWTRRVLGRLAADGGGVGLHLLMARDYLDAAKSEASSAGLVFYIDNHMRQYSGKHTLLRGWRMQDKRVKPGATDYYVHDEDGRPVARLAVPSHDSLTKWMSPIARLMRMALGKAVRILLAFDRGGAFPEQMAELRDEGFDFVTYERRPYQLLPASAFTEELVVPADERKKEERLLFCEPSRANLGAGRGRVRRIAVCTADGRQVNLLAISRRPARVLILVMLGRWKQENGFKHGVERWGINQLDGRKVVPYAPDTIIPNPARRRLEWALDVARANEGEARNELARLARADPRRGDVKETLEHALAQQKKLLALRPSLPKHAPVGETELADELVHHSVEYKMTLDTIRIACANAESDLAGELALHLPRAAEAKKTLANLFAAPGSIRVGKRSIEVCLSPAGTGPEQMAFSVLLGAINRGKLTLPGDQQGRRLRFRIAQVS